MARYKALKSVAHSFAHSFSSVMNYAGRDYAMCHLIRRAKLTGTRRFRLNVMTRNLGPVEMLTPAFVKACDSYCRDFGRLVTSNGAALDMIDEAQLEVQIAIGRPTPAEPRKLYGRVTAVMRIRDDRGKPYVGRSVESYGCAGLR
ncbi:MAG: hypothetical protein ACREN6_10420 [Gemmatimonadaceae bacterium]